MASILKHLRSSTADKRPTASGLADGQIAINTASGTPAMFFKDSAGNVVKVGPAHVGAGAPNASPAGSAGNSTGELWVNNSLTTPGLNYYTGSAFVNLTPSGTTSTVGLVELATNAETQAGSDAVRAVTSAGLQSKVSDSTSTTSSTTIASSTAVKSAYDLANAALPKSGGTLTGELLISPSGSLVFEGSSDDSFETTLAVTNPTADRTITFPDRTGTVITNADTGTVTSTMIADGTIVNADINASAAIAPSKLGSGALPSGVTVASANIVDGTIVNADVNASAAIAGTKISPDFGGQNVVTTGNVTGAALIPSSNVVPTNGVYLPSANTVALATNSTGQLFINSSGNVGVGTASPAVKLQVSASSAGEVEVARFRIEGQTNNPMLRVLSDEANQTITLDTTGSVAGTELVFKEGGSEAARIDSSGRLGLGTSSPATLLHLSSATGAAPPVPTELRIASTTVSSSWSTTDPWGRISFYAEDPTSGGPKIHGAIDCVAFSAPLGSSHLVFKTTSNSTDTLSEAMRITHEGNVGIGTAFPSAPLHIQDDQADGLTNTGLIVSSYQPRIVLNDRSTSQAYVDIRNDGSQLIIGYGPKDTYGTRTGEYARIDSAGRLLVGTSTSASYGAAGLLQILGTTNAHASIARITDNNIEPSFNLAKARGVVGTPTIVSSGDGLGRINFVGYDGGDFESIGAWIKGEVDGTPGANDMPGRLVFSTTADGASSPTERMRITQSGRVTTYSTDGTANIITSSQAAGTSNRILSLRHSSAGVNGGTESLLVYTNGNVQNTNNSYGAISDIKLKENIVDASSQWNDLKALQVRNYNFKEGQAHTQIGLIAQEVELVSPGLVNESPDRDEDGNNLGTVTKSVNYSVLYMKAVKALQEAMERIETLEQRLNDAGIA